jgi:HEPN domain-containing protein
MTKQEHIKHWKSSTNESWDSALYLASGKHFALSLFALHLSIEKLLKALWIKESITDTPPYTHDLQRLADEIGLDLQHDEYDLLSVINSWNIRGKYPDYSSHLHKSSTADYLQKKIEKISVLKKWLEEKI